MPSSMRKSLTSKWQRLTTHAGAQRLSLFALVLVFALDAFILSLVFKGTADAQRLVDQPLQHITRVCLSMSAGFLQEETGEQIQSLAWFWERMAKNKDDAISEFDYSANGALPICAKIRDQLVKTISNADVSMLLGKRQLAKQEIEKIESDIRKLKDTYSDALLEKIAVQRRSESILPVEAGKIRGALDHMEAELARLRLQLTETRTVLANHPAIISYTTSLNALPLDHDFGEENERFERLLFWYPIKVIAAQAGFILPLLLLAIFWNARAIKKQQDTQIMISAHLILVGAVPILIRLLGLVRDFLPEELIYLILRTLDAWKLSFIWYYFAILASVCGGVFLIFIAQRTFFSPARQRLIRLRKAQCCKCGEKLRSSEQAWCEMCGAGQSAPCGGCGETRRLLAFHCNHCGVSQQPSIA